MNLPVDFIKYLSEVIGESKVQRAVEAFDEPASTSVRLNPFKIKGVELPILEGSQKVNWSPYGYLLKERPVFTLHPLFHSGVYYVQDSSAMYVGDVCRRQLPDKKDIVRVLDLCAAPGGKTTDLAASLREKYGEDFLLVSNEVMRSRATILADNVARWGDPNVMTTCADPKAFASLEGFFDMVVADVPCSGEGMFRKDAEALSGWSVENVALCASRQKRILADMWPCLKSGGILVYSTCTFNIYENAENVEWICRELGGELLESKSLVPGFVPGEGQYCAAISKTSGSISAPRLRKQKAAKANPYFDIDIELQEKSGLQIALPSNIAPYIEYVSDNIPTISKGCAIGRQKGRDLVPEEDLALCIKLKRGIFPEYETSKPQALAFLRKDALILEDAPKGLLMLSYKGVPLGFVKNLGTRTNSLHPNSRRIRMQVGRNIKSNE